MESMNKKCTFKRNDALFDEVHLLNEIKNSIAKYQKNPNENTFKQMNDLLICLISSSENF